MFRIAFIWCALAALALNGYAQTTRITPHDVRPDQPQWVQLMYGNAHPETVKVAYEAYYSQHELVKNRDTQYYKRFMRNYMFSNYPLGDAPLPFAATSQANANQRSSNAWQEAGPWHYDPEVAMFFEVQSPGSVHAYTVEQAPSNPQVVFTGTATAGIWKSTDKGLNWQLMSRNLPVTSVYSIAINPNNENIVYFGGENGGIWKSTDGGDTWALTGDAQFQNQNIWTRDLRIAPNNENLIIAATSAGLFRSENAGETFTSVASGEHMEIEFHPNNPEIIYTVAMVGNQTIFKKSENGGLTFTNTGTGWPSPGAGAENRRCEISVSAATPDRVYVLAAGTAGGSDGLYGIYLSEDSGNTFTFQCCGGSPGGPYNDSNNPNILGWSEGGGESGGQYYYDLALGASPDIADRLFGAGINVWRSTNAGSSWTMNAHWVTWVGEFTQERYTHADVHDVKFFQTETGVDLWIASDGGVYYSADQGDNIEPRMYGIHGTDFWGWQAGWRAGETMVGGTYHNGTHIKNGDVYHYGFDGALTGGWLGELGGDNFRGFVNPGQGNLGYHDGGAFQFSDDRFTRITGRPFDNSKSPNTGYWFGEYGNLEWDPRCYNTFYSPVDASLWRTTNGGAAFDLVHNFGQGKIISVKVAPRDPNRIYVSHQQNGSNWNIWRTDDGGVTWTEVTIPTSVGGNNADKPIYLDVDGTNPDLFWAIFIGNHQGNKVFKSVNGGDTWTNITSPTIGNQYVTSIAHQRGSNEGVYIGTTTGVFYRDNDLNGWEFYNTNLPAVTPTPFMQANYCLGKIRSAGSRGVHEADFHTPSAVQAGFMADRLTFNAAVQCTPEPVHFSATSVVMCEGATYAWQFPGGVPTNTDQAETDVLYAEPGSYSVTLTVTDANGNSDTFTWENMITVTNDPIAMPLVEDFNGNFPPANWKIVSSGFGNWEPATDLTNAENGVAQFPNYWVNTEGNADLLVMPALDFSTAIEPGLSFDVAFRKFGDNNDGLEVWAQLPNEVWFPIYSKFGTDLEVDNCYMWFWYDLGGQIQWRRDTVDLSILAGEPCVTLAFANIGDYGNHIWIDNVNVTGDMSVAVEESRPNGQMVVFPNPSAGNFSVITPQSWAGQVYMIFDQTGKLVQEGRLNGGMEMLRHTTAPGMYLVVVPGYGNERIVVTTH